MLWSLVSSLFSIVAISYSKTTSITHEETFNMCSSPGGKEAIVIESVRNELLDLHRLQQRNSRSIEKIEMVYKVTVLLQIQRKCERSRNEV